MATDIEWSFIIKMARKRNVLLGILWSCDSYRASPKSFAAKCRPMKLLEAIYDSIQRTTVGRFSHVVYAVGVWW